MAIYAQGNEGRRMNIQAIINATRVAMLKGRRLTPKQIEQYEYAIRQGVNDNRVEAMMLYAAEALHDELGFGIKRTSRILNKIDESMKEWLDPSFQLDDLRIRVFEKTGFMFACTEEDQRHIEKLLKNAGYNVMTEEE